MNVKLIQVFMEKKIPKEGFNCLHLSEIVNHLVCKINKDYYQQVLLEECKYVEKERKTDRYITKDVEFFSYDDDDSGSEYDFEEKWHYVKCINRTLIHMDGILIVPCRHFQFISCQIGRFAQ